MSLTATATTQTQKDLPPTGNHIARCIQIIDLGTQKVEYMGEVKHQHKVIIAWELPEEKKVFDESKGEQPFVVSKEYTLILSDKANLRKDLEGWRGQAFTEDEIKGFDIEKLLNKPCMLSIIYKKSSVSGFNYTVINGIARLPKGLPCPDRINELRKFSLEDRPFNQSEFDNLYDWQKDKIKVSPEYKAVINPQMKEVETLVNSMTEETDLPF